MTSKPIIKQETRILTPREWYLLRENLNAKYKLICDCLLATGMRVEEFWELTDHTHWFSPGRRCIDLPQSAVGKARCTIKQRTILLSLDGVESINAIIRAGGIDYIDRSNMRRYLIEAAQRAGIDVLGIKPKMFRKTLVSWLVACLPEKDVYILASVGHSRETRERHYLSMGFERRDVEDMRRFLKGWGE